MHEIVALHNNNIAVLFSTQKLTDLQRSVDSDGQERNIKVLFCQPRVEVTSCFVYKVMGLTCHDRINTQLIYRVAVAQVVTRRITKPQGTFFRFESHWLLFLFMFFIYLFFFFWGGGSGGGGLISLFSSCLNYFSFYLFLLLLFIFYPYNMYKVHI